MLLAPYDWRQQVLRPKISVVGETVRHLMQIRPGALPKALLKIVLEEHATGRAAELRHGLGLNLPDALARDP
jgi:hypothetical protein